jgi:formamidopyrimidine-DNA glycosylase
VPELPEVETVARDLRPMVVGAQITAVRCDWPRTIRDGDVRAFTDNVVGRTIEGTGRRAKLLLLELSGDWVIAIHLKMTGQLFVVPSDAPDDRFVHVVFELADGRELRFRDIRKFGRIGLYVAADDPFAAIGPEPLSDAFTVAAFRKRLRARKGRLKPLLLDQSFVAGVGNIYADEALFLAGVRVTRASQRVTRQECEAIMVAVKGVLRRSIQRGGSSVSDYVRPDGTDGGFQLEHYVYARAGEPCLRCGTPVRRIVIGQRSAHYCSTCQK